MKIGEDLVPVFAEDVSERDEAGRPQRGAGYANTMNVPIESFDAPARSAVTWRTPGMK